MPQADLRLITECFERFRNADPPLYDKFTQLMHGYVTELTVAVTEADPGSILVAQGRAQQARKFLNLLTEFPVRKP